MTDAKWGRLLDAYADPDAAILMSASCAMGFQTEGFCEKVVEARRNHGDEIPEDNNITLAHNVGTKFGGDDYSNFNPGGVVMAAVKPITVRTVPQGLTVEQFESFSRTVRLRTSHLGDDVAVHGSRATGTARPDSDIDVAIRVTSTRFDEILEESFGSPNPGSARASTMSHAAETGKIQRGELKLSNLGTQLETEFDLPAVDISVIRVGGKFDRGPYIRLQ